MSKHIDFIKHEVEEYKEVHLTIPNSDINEAIAIAKANNLSIRITPKNSATTTVRIEK